MIRQIYAHNEPEDFWLANIIFNFLSATIFDYIQLFHLFWNHLIMTIRSFFHLNVSNGA